MILSTGDLILVKESKKLYNLFQDKFKYIHLGIIIKNPTFLCPSLKGCFVLNGHKTYQTNIANFNIEIIPIEDFIKKYNNYNIFVRKIKLKNPFPLNKLNEIYQQIYSYPISIIPMEWFPFLDKKPSGKANRSWAGLLVGYIYTKCNIIESPHYSLLLPEDFSKNDKIKLCNQIVFENEIKSLKISDSNILTFYKKLIWNDIINF